MRESAPGEAAVLWHDVECGGYGGDLPLWRELARRADGPVLDLGAGTGRVALDLAGAGYDVTALDSDPVLLDELARRAREAGLEVACVAADARRLQAIGHFTFIVAPMQFVQLMGGAAGRARLLEGVVSWLAAGGTFAAAIADLDEAVAAEHAETPLPDVGERTGWVYSSIPLSVSRERDGVAVEWLRQVVSPAGELTGERHREVFDPLTPEAFEREAAHHGLRAERRHELSHTDAYIGSTVVVCRR
jgi:SAM-dependent methyltransferase